MAHLRRGLKCIGVHLSITRSVLFRLRSLSGLVKFRLLVGRWGHLRRRGSVCHLMPNAAIRRIARKEETP